MLTERQPAVGACGQCGYEGAFRRAGWSGRAGQPLHRCPRCRTTFVELSPTQAEIAARAEAILSARLDRGELHSRRGGPR